MQGVVIMSFKDDETFRRQLESTTNIYTELRKIAASAREMSARYNNKILHSEAITHVIQETKPDIQYIESYQNEYEANYIRETFCYIDDKEVCNAVYDSFYESKKKKNLIFLYNSIEEPERQARVRVLTRMLWYKLIIQ